MPSCQATIYWQATYFTCLLPRGHVSGQHEAQVTTNSISDDRVDGTSNMELREVNLRLCWNRG